MEVKDILVVYCRCTSKWIFKKWGRDAGIELMWLRIGTDGVLL